MSLDFSLRALVGGFFLGLAVGGVCFAGLWWGFRNLVRGQEIEGPDRRKFFFRGALILGGQLLFALALLFLIPYWSLNPIALAGGVVVAIFTLGLLSQKGGEKP